MSSVNSRDFHFIEAQKRAEPLPSPPLKLKDAALQFWPVVINAKRRSAWTDADLVLACSLCRDLALLEKLADQIDDEGPTLVNDESGRCYQHPAAVMLDATTRRTLATARQLQIHSIATTGKTDHQAVKNETVRRDATPASKVSYIKRPGQ